ncbi:hypothetical protein GCM10007079_23420 [Nocardiopsis terrae]|nr:hypothetical protein GCM10007079_23420 [Nocardiopsis terrae]
MLGPKTFPALAGARWAWKRHRRGSTRPGAASADRRGAGLLAWGAAGAALGAGAAALSARGKTPRMNGKVVLVTGGSRGLGLQLAREFGARGATVVICARGREHLDRAVADLTGRGVRAHGVACDVTDPERTTALLAEVDERYGRLDVLVNNAGIMRVGPQQARPRSISPRPWTPCSGGRSTCPAPPWSGCAGGAAPSSTSPPSAPTCRCRT